ncbi:HpcH/HpaI aldolase family protein [Natrarchaeobius chitinivorans]|uniref:Aldolase n=1 Tax=Natrarchaeobius chitinivorans TaxID=1679083 RepID=A0A3N6M4M7_NATCH|nr:aldolase/citrate lyase family protein [Natrarchaeobius chitinivorans]RQG95454.1 aldolase [Natrarchaeobius chitinivorans]
MIYNNRIKHAIENDQVVLGGVAYTSSPMVIELCGDIGLDFVWVDLEHRGCSPFDSESLANLSRAAEVADTSLLVRLPGSDPDMIRKVLDSGIRNVLLPRVETPEEVRRAVKATKFTYEGEPGKRGGSHARTTIYGKDIENLRDVEDDSVCLGVMIETIQAIENLEEILSIPELGFVRTGPGDLSISLGIDDSSDPRIWEHREYLEETALEYDVPLSSGTVYYDGIEETVDAGYQIVTIGRDLPILRQRMQERYDAAVDGLEGLEYPF